MVPALNAGAKTGPGLRRSDRLLRRRIQRASQLDPIALDSTAVRRTIAFFLDLEPADLPKMLKPLDLNELKAYFLKLAVAMAQRVKPE